MPTADKADVLWPVAWSR